MSVSSRLSIGLLLAAVLSGAGAQNASSPYDTARTFDPSALKGPARGTPNEVMVLGSPHLSQIDKPIDARLLEGLLDRLAAWRPRIIAIEALSGPQCAFMRQYPGRYKDTIAHYCWDPAPARGATGLDVPAATAEVDAMLAQWPTAPTPAQRRRLASRFLAGGERASALVQWLHLPDAERHAGDGLDAALVEVLDKLRVRRNEDTQIASVLAARLGLERVVAMDDHTSDVVGEDGKEASAAIQKAWDNPATAQRTRNYKKDQDVIATADDVVAMYRAYNAPSEARLVFDSDFGATLNEPSARGYGRGYLAGWETRNLRMAANIREATGAVPTGARTLVIVGASHKWYLQAYLNQMHDMRIVDAMPVLH